MSEFKRKVNACKECGEIDQVKVTTDSVGCRRCKIFWACTNVPFIALAIDRWNKLNH